MFGINVSNKNPVKALTGLKINISGDLILRGGFHHIVHAIDHIGCDIE
jgi:hypothetical protein